MCFLCRGRRRVGPHVDGLCSNLGAVDCSSSMEGVPLVPPLRVRYFLLSWTLFRTRKIAMVLWRATPIFLLWIVWKERNKIIFQECYLLCKKGQISSLTFSILLGS